MALKSVNFNGYDGHRENFDNSNSEVNKFRQMGYGYKQWWVKLSNSNKTDICNIDIEEDDEGVAKGSKSDIDESDFIVLI